MRADCYDGGMARCIHNPTSVEIDPAFVTAVRNGTLTPQQAHDFAAQDRAIIELQMLQLTGLLAGKTLPHTPMRPWRRPSVTRRSVVCTRG
jgi:hypothetical protein